MIIKVEAIIREEKFDEVMHALDELQVNGLTVSKVQGYGAQRGCDNWTKGMKLEVKMKPKVKVEVVVSSEDWAELTVNAINETLLIFSFFKACMAYTTIAFPIPWRRYFSSTQTW